MIFLFTEFQHCWKKKRVLQTQMILTLLTRDRPVRFCFNVIDFTIHSVIDVCFSVFLLKEDFAVLSKTLFNKDDNKAMTI